MLLTLLGCTLATSTVVGRFDSDTAVTSAVVRVPTGDVRVDGDPAITEAHARWSVAYAGEAPVVTTTVTDGVFVVEVSCDDAMLCETDLDVAVPAGIPVDIEADTGDLTVVGLTGELSARVDTGDVTLEEIGGIAVLSIGTGDLDGSALAGELTADLGTGDATLAWSAPASVALDAGTGDVDLAVPAGVYLLDLEVGTGDLSLSGVQDDASAEHTISATVGTGDLTIAGR